MSLLKAYIIMFIASFRTLAIEMVASVKKVTFLLT